MDYHQRMLSLILIDISHVGNHNSALTKDMYFEKTKTSSDNDVYVSRSYL